MPYVTHTHREHGRDYIKLSCWLFYVKCARHRQTDSEPRVRHDHKASARLFKSLFTRSICDRDECAPPSRSKHPCSSSETASCFTAGLFCKLDSRRNIRFCASNVCSILLFAICPRVDMHGWTTVTTGLTVSWGRSRNQNRSLCFVHLLV